MLQTCQSNPARKTNSSGREILPQTPVRGTARVTPPAQRGKGKGAGAAQEQGRSLTPLRLQAWESLARLLLLDELGQTGRRRHPSAGGRVAGGRVAGISVGLLRAAGGRGLVHGGSGDHSARASPSPLERWGTAERASEPARGGGVEGGAKPWGLDSPAHGSPEREPTPRRLGGCGGPMGGGRRLGSSIYDDGWHSGANGRSSPPPHHAGVPGCWGDAESREPPPFSPSLGPGGAVSRDPPFRPAPGPGSAVSRDPPPLPFPSRPGGAVTRAPPFRPPSSLGSAVNQDPPSILLPAWEVHRTHSSPQGCWNNCYSGGAGRGSDAFGCYDYLQAMGCSHTPSSSPPPQLSNPLGAASQIHPLSIPPAVLSLPSPSSPQLQGQGE
nr:WAS/WASL-interacting protein family member 1-like [Chrysemys picta bellii]XP_042711152.1 WAS/WASL-interacting protein family member 1-like [Chrysemys picta bellii]XP_042711153.1 WAS/WASL-interacting protein family member 1-like [Chrysemys picta bellii]XP_042711155.1 WAS/WASL-interacting protein family member 1-like [Chrysemys picta bellii]XP_042711156.1 WAS/WASL-interacting protein family member 1-like [Chrysemys picta bellii]XP_042711157.1 WAS/WASL-interacting protein family member 1-like 